MSKKLSSLPQHGNSVSQNGMCGAGERLLVKEKIQPEMHSMFQSKVISVPLKIELWSLCYKNVTMTFLYK
jgi:hypothetical protein